MDSLQIDKLDSLLALPTEKDLPKSNQTVKVYEDWLRGFHSTAVFLDAKLGWVGWLRGMVFKLAKESSKVTRAEWKTFHESFGFAESTAYMYVGIAERYPDPANVLGKTMTELRNGNGNGDNDEDAEPKPTRTRRAGQGSVNLKNLPAKLDMVLNTMKDVKRLRRGGGQDRALETYETQAKVIETIIQRCNEALAEFNRRIDRLKAKPTPKPKGKTRKTRKAA